MRHLRNQAIELCKDLKENGLGGIRFFDTKVNSPTNPADDDITPEAAEAWDRDYCAVELSAEVYCDDFFSDHSYTTFEFDHSSFQNDLHAKFVEYFGDDVVKCMEKFSPGWEIGYENGETEVYRRSNSRRDFEGNLHPEPFDPLNANV